MRNNGIQHLLCSQQYYSAPCPSLQIRMRQSSYPIGLISKLCNCALDIEPDSIRISCNPVYARTSLQSCQQSSILTKPNAVHFKTHVQLVSTRCSAKNIVPILPKTKSHPISHWLSLNIHRECDFSRELLYDIVFTLQATITFISLL